MDKIGQYEIYGIYDFNIVKPWYQNFWFYISCIIFFVLIIVSLLFIFFKYRKKNLSPEAKALNELDRLQKNLNKFENNYDVIYLELTNILKKYVNEKFGINVMSATDIELIKIMNSTELKYQFKQLLEPNMKNIHLIKFSKQSVGQTQVINDIENMKKFVTSTSDLNKK